MRPEEEIALLRDLVACRSPSGEEHEAAGLFTKRLAAAGLKTSVDEAGNALVEVGEGEKLIVLLGHIDTVRGFPTVRREGDLLYGRGTVDAKGPLCSFASAVARLTPEDLSGKRILVCGAVEEEATTSKGARFLRDRVRPRFCIIGEPSGWRGITLGYKGRVLLSAGISTPRSHSAGQDATAAEMGAALWNDIVHRANEMGGDKEFYRMLPTLLEFQTDRGDLEDRVRLEISMRLPPGFDLALFEYELKTVFSYVKFSFTGQEEAFRCDRKNPLVRAFLRSIRKTEGNPRFILKTGTSDMNVVGPKWQCPIVAYGPGNSALDHTPDEHISLTEYHKAIQVLTGVLRSL